MLIVLNTTQPKGEEIFLESALTMPSPFGEGQTDTPINHVHLGEVPPPPFTHTPVLLKYLL
jgi:hypothetical protein